MKRKKRGEEDFMQRLSNKFHISDLINRILAYVTWESYSLKKKSERFREYGSTVDIPRNPWLFALTSQSYSCNLLPELWQVKSEKPSAISVIKKSDNVTL